MRLRFNVVSIARPGHLYTTKIDANSLLRKTVNMFKCSKRELNLVENSLGRARKVVRTECERCEPRCLADIPLIDHTDLQRQTKPILRRKPILIKKTNADTI